MELPHAVVTVNTYANMITPVLCKHRQKYTWKATFFEKSCLQWAFFLTNLKSKWCAMKGSLSARKSGHVSEGREGETAFLSRYFCLDISNIANVLLPTKKTPTYRNKKALTGCFVLMVAFNEKWCSESRSAMICLSVSVSALAIRLCA